MLKSLVHSTSLVTRHSTRLNNLSASWSQSQAESRLSNSRSQFSCHFAVETRWEHRTVCSVSVSAETVVHLVRWLFRSTPWIFRIQMQRMPHDKTLAFSQLYFVGMTGSANKKAGRLFIVGSSWPKKLICHLAALLYQQSSISSMKYLTSGLINSLCWVL